MNKNQKTKEKTCAFYASDYHFEMISLPYINESLKKNENVIIMTENNLDSTVDKVLSRINLDEEEKNKLTKIDWKNEDMEAEISRILKSGGEGAVLKKKDYPYTPGKRPAWSTIKVKQMDSIDLICTGFCDATKELCQYASK